MRNRIFAGVGIAALATVGVAAPATAISDTTADLYVVHGVVGVDVDVYVDGELTLEGFAPSDVAGPLDLPAGTYQVQVTPAGSDVADAVIDVELPLEANTSYSAVAHLDAEDGFTASLFENNISPTAAGEGRLTVRHTAAAPEVDVRAGGEVLAPFENVPNGVGADVDVPVDTYSADVVPTGTDTVVIGPADVDVTEGNNVIVYAVGSLADETLTVYTQSIEVGVEGGTGPEGIPAGSAGLVAENGSTGIIAGGVALLLLVLAAAGIIARRQSVTSSK